MVRQIAFVVGVFAPEIGSSIDRRIGHIKDRRCAEFDIVYAKFGDGFRVYIDGISGSIAAIVFGDSLINDGKKSFVIGIVEIDGRVVGLKGLIAIAEDPLVGNWKAIARDRCVVGIEFNRRTKCRRYNIELGNRIRVHGNVFG